MKTQRPPRPVRCSSGSKTRATTRPPDHRDLGPWQGGDLDAVVAVSATDRLTVSYEDPFASTPESVLMQVQDVHKPLKDTLGNHARKDSAAISITQSANSHSEFPSSETGARSVDENTPADGSLALRSRLQMPTTTGARTRSPVPTPPSSTWLHRAANCAPRPH